MIELIDAIGTIMWVVKWQLTQFHTMTRADFCFLSPENILEAKDGR